MATKQSTSINNLNSLLFQIKAIIAGEDQDDIRQKCLEKEILNEDEIVSCLITLATDEAVLGRSYAGWNPWL